MPCFIQNGSPVIAPRFFIDPTNLKKRVLEGGCQLVDWLSFYLSRVLLKLRSPGFAPCTALEGFIWLLGV